MLVKEAHRRRNGRRKKVNMAEIRPERSRPKALMRNHIPSGDHSRGATQSSPLVTGRATSSTAIDMKDLFAYIRLLLLARFVISEIGRDAPRPDKRPLVSDGISAILILFFESLI